VTTVQDTITYADGTTASGSIVLTWPPFQFSGVTITGGQSEYEIGLDGAISISLYPTVGALPSGVYYTASYHLDQGSVYEEYWVVPSVPAVTGIGALRTIPLMPQ
jgi:trimeric autotransporter adhesin